MQQARITTIKRAFIFVTLLWLLPGLAEAARKRTKRVDCDNPGRPQLQLAINQLNSGDTLLVSGTCNENVEIPEEVQRITLDGQGTATINGPDNTSATVQIRGRNITIKGFASITGGRIGVQLIRGGIAVIDGNTVHDTGGDGIDVTQGSSARIINTTVRNNPEVGVVVSKNSFAHLGFLRGDDTVAQPNTIRDNTGDGVVVIRGSAAVIVENTIKDNGGNGVFVGRVSQADISKSLIDNNGADGILVGQNSGVNLGRDSGTGIFEAPNDTTVGQENGGFGIRCFINSYADGRLGTLNGASGAKSCTGSSIDSLM